MRDYIFTTEAETTLESYVDYLLDQHAYGAAQEIRTYIELFIVRTLCLFPARMPSYCSRSFCSSRISDRQSLLGAFGSAW